MIEILMQEFGFDQIDNFEPITSSSNKSISNSDTRLQNEINRKNLYFKNNEVNPNYTDLKKQSSQNNEKFYLTEEEFKPIAEAMNEENNRIETLLDERFRDSIIKFATK